MTLTRGEQDEEEEEEEEGGAFSMWSDEVMAKPNSSRSFLADYMAEVHDGMAAEERAASERARKQGGGESSERESERAREQGGGESRAEPERGRTVPSSCWMLSGSPEIVFLRLTFLGRRATVSQLARARRTLA